MDHSEVAKLIGTTAQFSAEKGLSFAVVIRNARKVYGRVDYQIEPVGGSGLAWVDSSRVR